MSCIMLDDCYTEFQLSNLFDWCNQRYTLCVFFTHNFKYIPFEILNRILLETKKTTLEYVKM